MRQWTKRRAELAVAAIKKQILRRVRRELRGIERIMAGHDTATARASPISADGGREGELQEKLERIDQWCKAYPLDIFPEPDFKKARQLLADGGITLDAVSASNMRHVLNGIRKIIAAPNNERAAPGGGSQPVDGERELVWAKAVVEMDAEPDNIGTAAQILLKALRESEARVLRARLTATPTALPQSSEPSCDCTKYNGGQCYNCLNGAHHICGNGQGRCSKSPLPQSSGLADWHDRLGAMIDQVGHPDYSLRELVDGLRSIRDEMLLAAAPEEGK